MNTLHPLSLAGRMLLPNAERARYLRIVIRILIYVLIFRGFLHLFLFLKDFGGAATINGIFTLSLIDSAILIIPSILLIVFVLLWMARAYHNLHRAGLDYLRFSPGWAVGAWFVPFMNMLRPYYIVKEIWIRTQTAFREKEVVPRDHTMVKYWWIIYIVPPFLLGFVSALTNRSGSLESMADVTLINGFLVSFSQVIALFLLSGVVKSISAMEVEFAHRFLVAQAAEVQRTAEQYQVERSLELPQDAEEQAAPVVQESKIIRGEVIETKNQAVTIVVCLAALLGMTTVVAITDFGLMSSDSVQQMPRWSTSVLLFVSLLAVPPLVVSFIIWINRCYNNLRNLRIESLSVSPAWQPFWWIIPGANIFFAWNMLRDIKKHSQLALTHRTEEPEALPLLDWTWFAFLLGTLFFWIVIMLTDGKGYTGRDAELAMILNVCAWLLFLFGFISSIIVTLRINRFQSELFARVEAAVDSDSSVDYIKTVE